MDTEAIIATLNARADMYDATAAELRKNGEYDMARDYATIAQQYRASAANLARC